jgi:GNAT superfamily N-acetyltransferase
MSAEAEVEYVVTWLEAAAPPSRPRPAAPALRGLSLLRAERPPVAFFRYLYDVVGRDYEWSDLHAVADDEIRAFIQDPNVALYVAYLTGWPAGFVMLDRRPLEDRAPGLCSLAYFGLAPEAMGRGLGSWLLGTAVHLAWEGAWIGSPAAKLEVNTCTLDHPRALPLYQRWGFRPVRREQRRRRLSAGASPAR